ncbi:MULTISPECIES: hypothetical protein [Brevibacillus]|uniref:hypothetical protein n=1 Tax=Brevibacillus TaxID=55080 RepID=UPI000EB926A3|nr:hypothetical protein [Brevibacillus sp.]HBZ80245.1 hypothetical protein [Brevibacillus sp.]
MKRNPQHDGDPNASPWVDPNLESIQRVEGGAPKKVVWGAFPKWLQWFGGAFVGIFFTLIALLIFSALLK